MKRMRKVEVQEASSLPITAKEAESKVLLQVAK